MLHHLTRSHFLPQHRHYIPVCSIILYLNSRNPNVNTLILPVQEFGGNFFGFLASTRQREYQPVALGGSKIEATRSNVKTPTRLRSACQTKTTRIVIYRDIS
jgi:hypothetical protein